MSEMLSYARRTFVSPAFSVCRYALLGLALFFTLCQDAAFADLSPPLNLTNVAQTLPDKTWHWTAYISGDAAYVERVRGVIYTLHPTFSNPIQRICETENPLYPFALSRTGWGTFNLAARVEFKDGTSRDLTHFLNFENG